MSIMIDALVQHDNRGWFRSATRMASTIRVGNQFKTVLVANSESEVIDTYDDLKSALAGHLKYCKKYQTSHEMR